MRTALTQIGERHICKVNRRAVCMGNPLVRFWEGPGCNRWLDAGAPGHVVVASDEAFIKNPADASDFWLFEVPGLLNPFSTKNLSGCQIVADSQETCQMRGVKGERRYFAVYPGQENVPGWISVEIKKKFVFARKPKPHCQKAFSLVTPFFLHFFFFLTTKQLQKIKFKVFIFLQFILTGS